MRFHHEAFKATSVWDADPVSQVAALLYFFFFIKSRLYSLQSIIFLLFTIHRYSYEQYFHTQTQHNCRKCNTGGTHCLHVTLSTYYTIPYHITPHHTTQVQVSQYTLQQYRCTVVIRYQQQTLLGTHNFPLGSFGRPLKISFFGGGYVERLAHHDATLLVDQVLHHLHYIARMV